MLLVTPLLFTTLLFPPFVDIEDRTAPGVDIGIEDRTAPGVDKGVKPRLRPYDLIAVEMISSSMRIMISDEYLITTYMSHV